jgi:antitoxin ParD1/3/4
MSIQLSPQVEALIRAKVDSGQYASADEVVRAAIPLLDERDRLRHLRSLLAVGLEQADRGELIDLTPELLDDIDREVDERYRRGDQPSPDVCP